MRRILAYPHTMIGSDGLPHDAHPHPRLWGTFPRVLGHYARELGLMTIEEAVKRMTAAAGRARSDLPDRGVIAPGAYRRPGACSTPHRVIDRATFEQPTTPSEGIELVMVNGRIVWQDGRAPNVARAGSTSRSAAPAGPRSCVRWRIELPRRRA